MLKRVQGGTAAMLNFEGLATFVAVVEKGSFSSAARSLDITASSVSKKVSRLESDVGARLINRSTHELRLTEAGTLFFARARRILQEITEARESVQEAQDNLAGTLKLHLTPGTGHRVVMPLLLEFMKVQPELTFDIRVLADEVDILEEGFDMSIRSGAPDDRKLRSTSIACRRLANVQYRISASPAYFRQHGKPQKPADLANHNCLIYARQPSPREWWFQEDSGRPYAVHVDGHLVADEWSVIYEAALAGNGIARLLTLDGTPEGPGEPLESIFMDRVKSDRAVWAFYPRMRPLPKKLDLSLRYLQGNLRPR